MSLACTSIHKHDGQNTNTHKKEVRFMKQFGKAG